MTKGKIITSGEINSLIKAAALKVVNKISATEDITVSWKWNKREQAAIIKYGPEGIPKEQIRIQLAWTILLPKGQKTLVKSDFPGNQNKEEDNWEEKETVCRRCGEKHQVEERETTSYPDFCYTCAIKVDSYQGWPPSLPAPVPGEEDVEVCGVCGDPYRLYGFEPKLGRDPSLCDHHQEEARKSAQDQNEEVIQEKIPKERDE